jgi:cell fate regulator YaaT (PSP1 superfamily)
MEVSAVKPRNSYQVDFIYTNDFFIKQNSLCVIKTDQGIDLGTILRSLNYQNNPDLKITGEIIRKATKEDLEQISELKKIEEEAFQVCREFIMTQKLKMKLVEVKAFFDKTKIIFYFTAENRIDFRDLVKDLAAKFKKRIEMRQIGVRDEARLIGGYGLCGKEFCCCHKKDNFDSVSIKMAKEQNLNLNSGKISGMCGRLLCCLEYEYDHYKEKNRSLPKHGTQINSKNDNYTVVSVDTLQGVLRLKDNQTNDFIEVTEKDFEFRSGKYYLRQGFVYVEEEEEEIEFKIESRKEVKKEEKPSEKKPSYDIFQPRKKRK